MHTVQYTIRNIPKSVDQVIRKRAQESGTSFNQTVVDLLTLQTLGTTTPQEESNFNWLFNSNTLDESFDSALHDLNQVDTTLWQA